MSTEGMNTQADSPLGWVLYDGDCGFCSRWITYWAPTLRRVGLEIAPLQAPWVGERLDMDPLTLLKDVRLLFVDGGQLAGADVYRWVLRRLWWTWPLYFFTIVPGGRQIFDWSYRTFADNRMHISSTCELPPQAEQGG